MISDVVDRFINDSNGFAVEFIKQANFKAKSAAQLFFSIDNVKLREFAETHGKMHEFVYYLAKVYQNTVFFCNDDLIDEFKLIGISEEALRWYTSISDILNVLPPIVSEGRFLILTAPTLQYISFYLDQKIWDTLQREFGYVGKVFRRETNIAEMALYKYFERCKSRRTPRMSDFDFMIDQLLAVVEKIDLPFLKDSAGLMKIAGANVEKIFIGEIFNNCVIPNPALIENETSLNDRCKAFYPLARLIMKDEILYSESTFKTYNAGVIMYRNNWNKYQISRIKSLLVR